MIVGWRCLALLFVVAVAQVATAQEPVLEKPGLIRQQVLGSKTLRGHER
jgi:hypothetical protein